MSVQFTPFVTASGKPITPERIPSRATPDPKLMAKIIDIICEQLRRAVDANLPLGDLIAAANEAFDKRGLPFRLHSGPEPDDASYQLHSRPRLDDVPLTIENLLIQDANGNPTLAEGSLGTMAAAKNFVDEVVRFWKTDNATLPFAAPPSTLSRHTFRLDITEKEKLVISALTNYLLLGPNFDPSKNTPHEQHILRTEGPWSRIDGKRMTRNILKGTVSEDLYKLRSDDELGIYLLNLLRRATKPSSLDWQIGLGNKLERLPELLHKLYRLSRSDTSPKASEQ